MTLGLESASEGRRERRRREVHARIVGAAVTLFERKGFAGTTALEIAESADVAEKTFYNHFPTKQHLIQELAEASLADTERLLAEARGAGGSTAERLHLFFARACDEAEAGSRELAREVVLEMVRVAQVDGVGPERHRRLHGAFAALLADGVARGDVAPESGIEFLTELAVAAYLGIVINWVSLPDYPLRERLASVARLVGDAAATPAGECGAPPQPGRAAR